MKPNEVLQHAAAFGLRPLPDGVEDLLDEVGAPPRLVAHLTLVHDVACHLLDTLAIVAPAAELLAAAVQFGAATHDIGKSLHPSELSGLGTKHETAGRQLLDARGAGEYARFCETHGFTEFSQLGLEDLTVIVADKIWKGKRVDELEEAFARSAARATPNEFWTIYQEITSKLDQLSEGAADRLSWMSQFPSKTERTACF